jgi:hypothetical protein
MPLMVWAYILLSTFPPGVFKWIVRKVVDFDRCYLEISLLGPEFDWTGGTRTVDFHTKAAFGHRGDSNNPAIHCRNLETNENHSSKHDNLIPCKSTTITLHQIITSDDTKRSPPPKATILLRTGTRFLVKIGFPVPLCLSSASVVMNLSWRKHAGDS